MFERSGQDLLNPDPVDAVERARYRPCPGPWTAFEDGSAPLCSCHAVPDAWIDEAYPTYDIEPGTPCGSASCVCRYAEEV